MHFSTYRLTLIAFLSVLLLTACNGGQQKRMEAELLHARKMNKEYVNFTTDSVMKEVVSWYDRHGTPNERMEAHYLLGCTYRDLGEAPRAVDCYLDAAACADTTAADCDFYTMGCVYAQMADLYHKQFLLSYVVDAEKKATHSFYLAKDTAKALFEQKMTAGAYILLNKRDSAEITLNAVMHSYREKGSEQEALQASTMLMHLLIDSPERQAELKRLIDIYEAKCELFDKNHELPPHARLFNYYKGKYYENIGLLDSAVYYYRNIYSPRMASADRIPLYRGLFSIFAKKGDADSLAKYAQLYCDVNDSSIVLKDQAATAQVTASYNYNRYQREAQVNERLRHKTELQLTLLGVAFCLVIVAGIYAARLYKNRQLKKRKALEETHRRKVAQMHEAYRQQLLAQENLFNQKEAELRRMEDIYHKVTKAIRTELDNAKNESQNMRENYTKAKQTIDEINAHFEKDKTALNEEIQTLKNNIAELKKREVFTDNQEMAKRLHATDIVTRLKARADLPTRPMTAKEAERLNEAFSQFFPLLVQDIKTGKSMNKNDEAVVLLTALGMKPGQIQCLTDKSPSQITNSKAKTNRALFADNSATSLYSNLVLRYGV